MSEQIYKGILTPFGATAIIDSLIGGSSIKISYMGIGDGKGEEYTPEEGQQDLLNEVYEIEIQNLWVDEKNPNWLWVRGIIPEKVGGFWIREVSIKDEKKQVVGISSWASTRKPIMPEGSVTGTIITIGLEVSNTGVFELVIDTSKALVTIDDFLKHTEKTQDVHGSAVDPLPYSIVERTKDGRAKVAQPQEPNDAAQLQQINDVIALIEQASNTGTPYFANYTGNGTRTRFELMGLTDDNPQAVLVTLNGVVQNPNTSYRIETQGVSAVVFNVAPPSGVAINLRTMVTATQFAPATELVAGAVRLATQHDLNIASPDRAVTPALLNSPNGLHLNRLSLTNGALRDTARGSITGLNGQFSTFDSIPLATSPVNFTNPQSRIFRFSVPTLLFSHPGGGGGLFLSGMAITGDIYHFVYTGEGEAQIVFIPPSIDRSHFANLRNQEVVSLMFTGYINGQTTFCRVV